MDADTSRQPADKSPSPAAQAAAHLQRRIRSLQAAFQRRLNHKPDTLERALRDHAAVTMAKVELAARDPSVSPNDFRALDSAARKARADFERVVARDPAPTPDLRSYLASKAS
jgi:hypothetical protein